MPVPSAVIRAWISLFCRTLSMRLFSTLRILPRSGRTACVLGSRPCLGEPPAEWPPPPKLPPRVGRAAGGVALDHEDLGQRRVLDRTVGELARQRRVLQRGLAPREVARLAGGRARLGGRDRLPDDPERVLAVLLQELGEAGVDHRGDEALHARVAELGLGLALELRVGELGRDHRRQALAHVLAGEVVVLLLEDALLAG